MTYLLLSNFSKIPNIAVKPRSEEPPADTKGKGIPMMGISPIVIPTLIKKWKKKIPTRQ